MKGWVMQYSRELLELDTDIMILALIRVAEKLKERSSQLGAVVLEGANHAP